jgi:hypothetical protein
MRRNARTAKPPTKPLRADRSAHAEQLVLDSEPGRTPLVAGAAGLSASVSSIMRDKDKVAKVHPLRSGRRPDLPVRAAAAGTDPVTDLTGVTFRKQFR